MTKPKYRNMLDAESVTVVYDTRF